MALAAVVLAAGASARMGTPKALLARGGETALGRAVRVAGLAGCAPVVVVLGRDAASIEAALGLALRAARIARNPAPERGRTGSLKAGLAACPGAEGVLVWPVDHPEVHEATILALAGAWARERPAILVPTHAGRRGHPLILRADAADEARALADDQPLRDVVRRDPARVRELPVGDPGILANLDTPEDAARGGWTAGRRSA